MPAPGRGIRLGTTVVMVSDGMILGGMVLGTDIAVCIAHGIIAGTIPGTTDGTTHGTAHGDGLTTAHTTAGTRLIGMVDIITIIHTILAEVVVVTTPTDLQATLVL